MYYVTLLDQEVKITFIIYTFCTLVPDTGHTHGWMVALELSEEVGIVDAGGHHGHGVVGGSTRDGNPGRPAIPLLDNLHGVGKSRGAGGGDTARHPTRQERIKYSNVAGHLLHPADLALLLCVSELDDEAGGGPRHGLAAVQGRDGVGGGVGRRQLHEGAALAVAVWTPQYRALLDGAKGLEDVPDLVLGLLLTQHSDEQLPVLAAVGLVVGRLDLEGTVHPGQCDLLVQGCLGRLGRVSGAVGEEGAALMHPRELVLEHGELVNLSKLFKHGSEVVVLQVARDLSYKQLHSVLVLLGVVRLGVAGVDGQVEAVGRVVAQP